ncbi:MAG TPA: low molecular weight protein-tyrosine-phosphatase [Steroidobacteraceae bacterium]|nr:low molecular weight protein-tyrosine-phosphatase [Steroidobacteraceae bacterium]
MTSSAPVRVLFVCAGNICRSPTAEAVLRALASQLAPQLRLEIDSAGTHGLHAGDAPDARAQAVARAHGVDMSRLRARQLTVGDFGHFDWILVMDRQNHAAALSLAPPQHRRRLRLFMEFAPHLRHREIPDPYYGVQADFELVFTLAEQAARGLLRELARL